MRQEYCTTLVSKNRIGLGIKYPSIPVGILFLVLSPLGSFCNQLNYIAANPATSFLLEQNVWP